MPNTRSHTASPAKPKPELEEPVPQTSQQATRRAVTRQPSHTNSFGYEFGTSLALANMDALKNSLLTYKYVSPNLTLFEVLFLNNFWIFCQQKFLPKWLAPNVITLTGFICIMISFIMLLVLSPNMDGSAPRWWYVFTSITCIIYQTMDGCDGKQARATKSGSPLGELFDHGVDALVTPIYVCFTIELQGFGINSSMALVAIVLSQAAFAMSNLTLLHLGKQEFNRVDCQEVQVVIQAGLMLTFFTGSGLWMTEVPILQFKNIAWLLEMLPTALSDEICVPGKKGVFYLRGLSMIWSVGCMAFNFTRGVWQISSHYFVHVTDTGEYSTALQGKIMKEGQGIALFIQQLGTTLVYMFLNLICWSSAREDVKAGNGVMAPICWTILSVYTFGDLMGHLLICRVGQLKFPALYRNRGFWLLCAYWVTFGSETGMFVITGLSVLSHTQYVVTMARAVCAALNIRFFTIPYTKEQ